MDEKSNFQKMKNIIDKAEYPENIKFSFFKHSNLLKYEKFLSN